MFDALVDDMDAALLASLNDGAADYLDATETLVASGIAVMVDRDVQHAGPDGLFVTVPVSVTWRKAQLAAVERGGRFVVGADTFIVEDILADDGHLITVSCLEAP